MTGRSDILGSIIQDDVALSPLPDRKSLLKALKAALRMSPPFRDGAPKRLLNFFLTQTSGWLARGCPSKPLPLYSQNFLVDRMATWDLSRRNRRAAADPARRAEQHGATLSAALTALAKRLRESPICRPVAGNEESLLLGFEITIGGERFEVEMSGPLAKHRDRLDFPESERLGFLARIARREAMPMTGAASTPGEEHPSVPRTEQEAPSQSSSPSGEHVPLASSVHTSPTLDAISLLTREVAALSDTISEYFACEPITVTPRQIPPPPRDFAGREEVLRHLIEVATRQSGGIVALQGPGGIGKTALGLSLAQELASAYRSTIFLDLKGTTEHPLTPTDVMRYVICSYEPGRSLPDDDHALPGMYQSLLNETPAFLFFDNVSDAAQLHPLIPPAHCFLLLTSRGRFYSPGAFCEVIQPLKPDDAASMLVRIAPRSAPAATAIAELCGYFPLALRAAGHALAETPNVPLDLYVQQLQESRTRLGLVDPTTNLTVEAALDLSYRLLSPELQHRFDALAVLPGTFAAAAAEAIWRIAPDQARYFLSQLLRRSLVEYDETSNRYHLHDVLRAFCDIQLRPSARFMYERRVVRHFRKVLRSLTHRAEEESTLDGDTNSLLRLEWPNIVHAHAWATSHAEASRCAARALITFPLVTNLYLLPISRDESIRWTAAGSTIGSSRLHCRLAAMNLTRQASIYATTGHVEAGLGCLSRLPRYISKLGELPTISFLLLVLTRFASEYSASRAMILEFLLPFGSTESRSPHQPEVLAAIARLYTEMQQHAKALAYYDRALDIADDSLNPAVARQNLISEAIATACDARDCRRINLYVDCLIHLAIEPTRSTTELFGTLAPMIAGAGEFDRGEELYELYRVRSQHPSYLQITPKRVASLGKAWYTLKFLGLYRGNRGTVCEHNSIECLEQAIRTARERNAAAAEADASHFLGLIHAANRNFHKAKELLPKQLYRRVVRGGLPALRLELQRSARDVYDD
jgi:tetratricopeptide (TPR) repeat protein